MTIRGAVIGAGNIGSALDAGPSATPLTHAGGLRLVGCDLVGLMDISSDLTMEAAKWGCPAFTDFDQLMQVTAPQLLCFATPASIRPDLMRQALKYEGLQAVIAEKPLAMALEEARQISVAYRDRGIPLIVNYSRRYVPVWQELAGCTALSAVIKYAKGIAYNGTHAIDLARMLFGDCLHAKALHHKFDFWDQDPTITAHLSMERCPDLLLQGLDERCFTLFEADIIGCDFRIIVDQDGRRKRVFSHQDQVGIPPGKRLVEQPAQESGGAFAMRNLILHALDVLAGKAVLCTGFDAVESMRIAQHLSDQVLCP